MTSTGSAQSLQGRSNAADMVLTEEARLNTPRVRWWWGRRWRDGQNGAWCYLCDRMIATWSSKWPMTLTAVRAVNRHRRQHLQLALDSQPHRTEDRP